MTSPRVDRGFAFGLSIASEIPLPHLLRVPGDPSFEADVSIVEGAPEGMTEVLPTFMGHRFAPEKAHLACGEGLTVAVEHGARIVVPKGADLSQVHGSLVGPILGTVVLQRGMLALHASAVLVDGAVVAICAASGAGKSVTVAALHLSGCPLVTDDVLAVSPGEPQPLVDPAYPLVKLWAEGAVALGLDPEALQSIEPDLGKLALDCREGFRHEAQPLSVIVVLEPSERPEVVTTELTGGEAVAALVEHSYGSTVLRQTEGLARHFEQLTDLVRRVRITRLRLPRTWTPAEVADTIRRVGLGEST